MRDTVINHLNGGRGMAGRVPVRRGKTISWIDAPDDVYFFATDNTRSVFECIFVGLCFNRVIHTGRMRKCDVDSLVGTFTLTDTEIDSENVTMGVSGTVLIYGFRTHPCNPL